MKLKKFNQLFEREGFDDIDEPLYPRKEWNSYDDDDDDYSYDKEYEGEDEDDSDDDMSHLCYLLRSMFNNSNVDVNVENSGLDLSITAQFARRESLSDIVKVFEIIKKIKKDVLAQYSSSYEMWETKSGSPMITFEFMLEDEDDDKDGIVTGDKDDDYPW
jgi:hypothetical protein